jgi:RNA polymerase sigma factor (sigma-70 family)
MAGSTPIAAARFEIGAYSGAMTEIDLDQLAIAAAGGDSAALDRLLVAIRPQVLRHCKRVLPNDLDAEEACQDALLSVARRIDRFEGRSRVSTWLYRITVNAALDTYRRLKRRADTIDLDSVELTAAQRTSVIAGNRIDLLEALDEVDPKFGVPVMLRDVYDLDYPEIAEALDIPEGTVKSRIHEGRKTMQYLLNR